MCPPNTKVFLPDLPNDPPTAIQDAIYQMASLAPHLEPVPHIAASRVKSRHQIKENIRAWQLAADQTHARRINQVLIVRGDAGLHDPNALRTPLVKKTNDQKLFKTSLELLQSGILEEGGISKVGLCGHPEGLGKMNAREALSHLIEKLQTAEKKGLSARVVTQFSFHTTALTDFVKQVNAAGFKVPLSLGFPGPAQSTDLRKMARICDVSMPSVEEAHKWPVEGLNHLAQWYTDPHREVDVGELELHLYPFGGLRRTLMWLAYEEKRSHSCDGTWWNTLGVPSLPLELSEWARGLDV